ncbi:hypothetical protein CU669_09000 [Paramagnetospirillum kuznetsovii]|uniref:Uncharacterized protein n=1 Tax=Paramagnetospirillum kuznetsovii TaxID=2053833 RepID=A0A364NYU4_9PROT|nr:hypothetical protein CU669_09000 [Paramagnetospirillum kuznetsovii]
MKILFRSAGPWAGATAVATGEHELMIAALEHMQRLDDVEDRSERYRARASFAHDLKRFIERIDIKAPCVKYDARRDLRPLRPRPSRCRRRPTRDIKIS